ncbi:MAG: protease family protein, partial [Actinomycetota bacterium]|nr:protease family protein [Actinomycetota bacterium]
LTLGVLFVNGLIQLGVMELFGEIKTASDQLGVEEGSLNPSDVWLLLLSTSLVAPVVEEFLFRGLLYRWLRERRGVRAAAVISAAIFAVTHFIPLLMPSIFVLGLALAWVAERYGSLYPPLALHATFNAIATLALVAAG